MVGINQCHTNYFQRYIESFGLIFYMFVSSLNYFFKTCLHLILRSPFLLLELLSCEFCSWKSLDMTKKSILVKMLTFFYKLYRPFVKKKKYMLMCFVPYQQLGRQLLAFLLYLVFVLCYMYRAAKMFVYAVCSQCYSLVKLVFFVMRRIRSFM